MNKGTSSTAGISNPSDIIKKKAVSIYLLNMHGDREDRKCIDGIDAVDKRSDRFLMSNMILIMYNQV